MTKRQTTVERIAKRQDRWRNPHAVRSLRSTVARAAMASPDGAYATLDLGAAYSIGEALGLLQRLLAEPTP